MFELIERKENYRGPIFTAYTDTIRMPDGSVIRRDAIEKHQNAAAVLAIKDNGNVVFVRQYRRSANAEVLEIPAGIADKGETTLECAVRELEEEAGLKAGKIDFMFKFYSCIGFCDEVVNIYLASKLTEGVQNFDDDESITLEEYPLEEAIEMIFDGRIVDSKTVSALLGYEIYKKRTGETKIEIFAKSEGGLL